MSLLPPELAPFVTELRNAWILPCNGEGRYLKRRINNYAILTETGEVVKDADTTRDTIYNYSAERVLPEKGDYLPGTHLFGAVLFPHFGHLYTEVLSRLYAWPELRSHIDSVLFVSPMAMHVHVEPNAHVINLFTGIGMDTPYRIVPGPVQVERLFVPRQIGGMGDNARGEAVLHQYFERLCGTFPAEGPEKLFISRSKYQMRRGGVICEPMLEENFVAQGYTLFSPEKESIGTQIARYRAARFIVGLDSSAFHVAASVCNRDMKAAIVLRRHTGHMDIAPQVSAFTGREPLVVNAIRSHWRRDDGNGRRPWDFFADLDFAKVRSSLLEGGFISADLPWQIPTEEDAVAFRDHFRKVMKKASLVPSDISM